MMCRESGPRVPPKCVRPVTAEYWLAKPMAISAGGIDIGFEFTKLRFEVLKPVVGDPGITGDHLEGDAGILFEDFRGVRDAFPQSLLPHRTHRLLIVVDQDFDLHLGQRGRFVSYRCLHGLSRRVGLLRAGRLLDIAVLTERDLLQLELVVALAAVEEVDRIWFQGEVAPSPALM